MSPDAWDDARDDAPTAVRPPTPEGRVALAAVAGIVIALVVAYAEIAVVGRAWEACDAGSGGPNGFVLLLSMLMAWGFQALLLAGLLMGGVRRGWLAVGGALMVGAVLCAAAAWGLFAFSGLPMESNGCPAGAPTWWPSWLPPDAQPYP